MRENLLLEMPVSPPRALTVVRAPGGHPVHVCLHDHGVENLVDAAPAFQQ